MKLDHLQLAMPPGKEDQARSFFIDIFDMIEESKPQALASRGGCWFRKGNVILHIGVEEAFSPQKKAHPAFVVEDLENLVSKLHSKGYPISWDSALPHRMRFYTADPFGNRIEIIKKGDGFSEK